MFYANYHYSFYTVDGFKVENKHLWLEMQLLLIIAVLSFRQERCLVSDSPEVNIDFRQPSAIEPGWLNCTVSSNPASNITWYTLSPFEAIVDNIVRGDNFLNYKMSAGSYYEGDYRCTADNGLGIVVNSETRIIRTRKNQNIKVFFTSC